MKRSTLVTILSAALLGVTARAQIITNYGIGDGSNTNSGAYNAANGFPEATYDGTWDGGSGKAISPGAFIAQTFLTPGSAGTVQLYAYNFQLNIQGPNTANPTFQPTFTSAVYAWTPTTDGNAASGTKGTLVAGTTFTFTPTIGQGFNLYGTNSIPAPGFGATLNANTIYALVIQRTDAAPTGDLSGSVVQYGWDVGGDYVDGGLYTSALGTSYARAGSSGTQDLAFWASFQAASLSPVPEPAVSGALIGAGLVVGLAMVRRHRNKKATGAPAV